MAQDVAGPGEAAAESGEGAGAQDVAPPERAPIPPIFQILVLFGPLVLLWWLIILRPNRRREQQHRQMLAQIRKNDHVITVGGIKGVVSNVKEDEIVIRVDDSTGSKIRVLPSSIRSVVQRGESEESQ